MTVSRFGRGLRVALFNLLQVAFYSLFYGHLRQKRRDLDGVRELFAFAKTNNIVLRVRYVNNSDNRIHERDVEVTDANSDYATCICRLRERHYRCFKMVNVISAQWSGRCYLPSPASTGLTFDERIELRGAMASSVPLIMVG